MYGWRARLGLLVPSNNNVIEPELYEYLPPGISAHGTMMYLDGLNDDAVHEMEGQALRGAHELAGAHVDVVAYACMGTTFSKEQGWGHKLAGKISESVGIPCTTASLAMIDALQHMGVERVAVGTPYPAFVNARIPEFFGEHGVEVTNLVGLELDMDEVVAQPPSVAYRLAREVNDSSADGICVLATDFQTLSVIEDLEQDMRKPVLSTNQTLLWRCLDLAGAQVSLPLGALFNG